MRGASGSEELGAVCGIGPGVETGSTHGSSRRTCLIGSDGNEEGGGVVRTAS